MKMTNKQLKIRHIEYLITEVRKEYAAGDLSVNEFNQYIKELKAELKEVQK